MINDAIVDEKKCSEICNANLQQNGFFIDSSGNKCTRRLFGTILISLGIGMGITIFGFGLTHPTSLFEGSFDVMQLFLVSGGGLLGISILENVGKFFNKQ